MFFHDLYRKVTMFGLRAFDLAVAQTCRMSSTVRWWLANMSSRKVFSCSFLEPLYEARWDVDSHILTVLSKLSSRSKSAPLNHSRRPVSSLASVSVLRYDVTEQVLTHNEPERSKILVTGRQNFYKENGVILKGYSTHDIEQVIQMTQVVERKDEGDKE